MTTFKLIDIAQDFNNFDDILDVRSPAEYFDDHIPGAINVPVLNDEERVRIGTLYTRVSPFAAKKLGAALVAKNIAQHLENQFMDKPKSWRPLVYCWRGGMRSGAFAHILAQIGWYTSQLAGGYKTYRRSVIDALNEVPKNLNFCVINGGTGSGKSHLLHALALQGAQVLDLEALAQHRGSLLGRLPGKPQPSQRKFESTLWHVLKTFDSARNIYVEAESRKVGVLSLPTSLVEQMRLSPCVHLEVPQQARVEFLIKDYAHFLDNPDLLTQRLLLLVEMQGHTLIKDWCELAQLGKWELLVNELLSKHYDPAYRRTASVSPRNPNLIQVLKLASLNSINLKHAAKQLIEHER